MLLPAVLCGIFVYLVFVLLFHRSFVGGDQVHRRLDTIAIGKDELNAELAKPFTERFIRPAVQRLMQVLTHNKTQKQSGNLTKLERELRLGGVYIGAMEFSVMRLVIVSMCAGLSFIIAAFVSAEPMIRLFIAAFGMILGVLIPRYYLKSKVKKRQNAIRSQLPDLMDLLSVSVEAGLSFDAALLRVCEHSSGPLVEELMMVYRETQMGKPRREAMRSLGERNSVEELKTFTGAMSQAEQMGIPVRNVLRTQAQQLRLGRSQRAEEKAMKAPIKMMIPLVAFIFPVLFIVLLGPAMLRIMQTFASM
ncbi:MAG: type II secretion system F family protein [Clostridia bacterium]|nr:type II secretion system F family protein [Clostridia bacterium]